MVKRLRHHPFTVVTGVRFPLESPKYGRFARPYFFGESHPCYAYCFAIRDRLHAIAPRHIHVSPFPIGNRCKAIPLGVTKIRTLHSSVFFWGISPLLCVLLRNPRQAARDYTEAPRASPFPIGNRCKAIPLGVTKIRTFRTSVFFWGISPLLCVLLRNPRQAARDCTEAPRASPLPNLGARCKAAHISAMQKKPFLVQVVLGFSFSVGLSQCPFRSRRATCLFNHPPQCHKMSN